LDALGPGAQGHVVPHLGGLTVQAEVVLVAGAVSQSFALDVVLAIFFLGAMSMAFSRSLSDIRVKERHK